MSEVSVYTNLQVLAYDPTRTTPLRTAFVRDMRRRFSALIKIIREAIIDQDCFGLTVQTNVEVSAPYYRAFDYPTNGAKLEAFMNWLQIQEDRDILEESGIPLIGASAIAAWTNKYITDAYKVGIQRARAELIRQGYTIPTLEASGGVEAVLNIPSHADRLGVLLTNTFQELKGITAAMDSHITRILAQGLLDGENPRRLARKIVSAINGVGAGEFGITDSLGRFIPAYRRAETMARTEIIRAHHLANIEEYKTWQAAGVTVVAEFSTAGDDRVCTQCAGMHGNTYTLKEIEHMIPVHPNCRCIAIPISTITNR